MKNKLNRFSLLSLLLLITIGITYGFGEEWKNYENLSANSGKTLNSSDWNNILSNLEFLKNKIENLESQDQSENIQELSILQKVYPIGHILITTNSANPNTYLGFGTWIAWGAGKVPVGVNTGETEFSSVEKTGGAKTHTLTVNEMPSHRHGLGFYSYKGGSKIGGFSDYIYDGTNNASGNYGMGNAGGSQSHNNLQPYITAYMWKRTN